MASLAIMLGLRLIDPQERARVPDRKEVSQVLGPDKTLHRATCTLDGGITRTVCQSLSGLVLSYQGTIAEQTNGWPCVRSTS